MTITDAELSAMYGRGLHPDTAARVIDEVRRLRHELQGHDCEVIGYMDEIDRLRFQLAHARYEARDEGEAANRGYGALLAEKNAEIDTLRARLAEVEAERDRYRADYTMTALENEQLSSCLWGAIELRDAAEAKLAAVEYVTDQNAHMCSMCKEEVRAAARGEDDRD